MTADVAAGVESDPATFDQVLPKANSGSLNARLDRHKAQSVSVGVGALGCAVQVAGAQNLAVVMIERLKGTFEAVRQRVDRRV